MTAFEEKHRELFEVLHDAVYMVGADGRISFFSPAAEHLIACPAGETAGRPFLDFVHPEDHDLVKNSFREVLAGQPVSFDCRLLDRSGRMLWVRASNRLLHQGRAITGILGALADRTDVVRLEQQLRHTQKMEVIGTLAGGIAHDFNNILAIILGYTELAIDESETQPAVRELLEEVMTAGERAKNLISQILAFSRPSEAESGPIQVHLVVKEVAKLLRATLPNDIDIRLNIDTMDAVLGDPGQIQQIIMNLCTNAYEAMRDTGGTLTIELYEMSFSEKSPAHSPELEPGDYICLSVADTGIGMDESVKAQIFTPYFTTHRHGESTGLGLSTVHSIVKENGGGILVTSSPAQGAVFQVCLPRAEKRRPPVRRRDRVPAGGKERIMLVEDEVSLGAMTRTMLTRLGYDVTFYAASTDALERVREDPEYFDLVITDLSMPQLTGERLAERMMQIRPDIPVILVTGFSERFDEKMASEAGIRAFLRKPLIRSQVAAVIRRILDNEERNEKQDEESG